MFTKILVTLDGSDLSERALEPAFHIAQKFDAKIFLLRVLTAEFETVGAGMGLAYNELRSMYDRHDREEAATYLQAIKAQWQGAGVPVYTRVMTGAPPEMILAVAEEAGVDLIVMSTHGRAGLSRLLYGSVAEAVLRGTQLPVLLIPVK
jgi:nucleotide-binding universal stress UspA family protein